MDYTGILDLWRYIRWMFLLGVYDIIIIDKTKGDDLKMSLIVCPECGTKIPEKAIQILNGRVELNKNMMILFY